MIPNVLEKDIRVMNAGVMNKSAREAIWREINVHRSMLDCFGFLEWAEPFVARLNRRYPLADARLLTAEEYNELGII